MKKNTSLNILSAASFGVGADIALLLIDNRGIFYSVGVGILFALGAFIFDTVIDWIVEGLEIT